MKIYFHAKYLTKSADIRQGGSYAVALFDPADIAEHTKAVAQDVDLARAVVNDLDRHLGDPGAEIFRLYEHLKIEREAVDLAGAEDLLRGLAPEALEAALGVAEPEARRKRETLYIGL